MKWTNDRADNVDDRRGSGGGGMLVGGGLGTLIIAAIIFFLGGDPSAILSNGVGNAPQTEQRELTAEEVQVREFVRMLSAENNQTWTKIFSENGMQYREPKIVLFENVTQSGCGTAQAAMGPFYCPADEGIYLDVGFFDELSQRFGAGGDFAAAYVIAHEVGHHIQTITGTSEKVRRAQERASKVQGNQLQVAMELQADCYAGVWARNDTDLLEAGDIEEGLRAAQAIGDDTLQRASQGVVVPESFTHGSSEQRMAWLKRGLDSGDPAQCNTFGR